MRRALNQDKAEILSGKLGGAAVAPQRGQPPTPTGLQTLEDVEAGHIRRALKSSRGVIE